MKSNTQLGKDYQKWIADWIKEKHPDAAIHNFIPFARQIGGHWISLRNDLFGCIDLICVQAGKKPLYIQATCGTNIGRKMEALSQVPWDFSHATVQIWRKRPDGMTVINEVYYDPHGGLAYRKIGEISRRQYTKTEVAE